MLQFKVGDVVIVVKKIASYRFFEQEDVLTVTSASIGDEVLGATRKSDNLQGYIRVNNLEIFKGSRRFEIKNNL